MIGDPILAYALARIQLNDCTAEFSAKGRQVITREAQCEASAQEFKLVFEENVSESAQLALGTLTSSGQLPRHEITSLVFVARGLDRHCIRRDIQKLDDQIERQPGKSSSGQNGCRLLNLGISKSM